VISFLPGKGVVIRTKLLSWIPFIPIHPIGLTLGVLMIINPDYESPELIDHEAIHVRQYLELLFVGFVVLYLGWWIINRLKGMNSHEAYEAIPFEKEARAFSSSLKDRRWFGWIRFIKDSP
tara:strand:- start:182 stop:544 length:363 start_codon:yes stop_codon:yes gene_type:complete